MWQHFSQVLLPTEKITLIAKANFFERRNEMETRVPGGNHKLGICSYPTVFVTEPLGTSGDLLNSISKQLRPPANQLKSLSVLFLPIFPAAPKSS